MAAIVSSTLPSNILRVHITLRIPDKETQEKLTRYAGVKRGGSISRDLLVPANMPLSALHCAIQRAVGFYDSHTYGFNIYQEDAEKIVGASFENLLALQGIIFTEGEKGFGVPFNMDRFFGGYVDFRQKYVGPYTYEGDLLKDCQEVRKEYKMDQVYYHLSYVHEKAAKDPQNQYMDSMRGTYFTKESLGFDPTTVPYVEWEDQNMWPTKLIRCKEKDKNAMKATAVKLGDMDLAGGLELVNYSLIDIIKRLPLNCAIAPAEDGLTYDVDYKKIAKTPELVQPQMYTQEEINAAINAKKQLLPKPFVDIMLYRYDFGDGWSFDVTTSRGCSDLLKDGVIDEKTLGKAITKVQKKLYPVMIAADGDMLIEDVGGVYGYSDFMEFMDFPADLVVREGSSPSRYPMYSPENDGDDYSEKDMTRSESLEWALDQGWHKNDFDNLKLL